MKSVKYAALVATVFTILLLLSGTALAAFSGDGTGTAADPYQITNISQLKEVKDNLTASYILMKDLEITDSSWTAIGNNSKAFNGTFDGNGNTITFENASGIKFERSGTSSSDGRGLFGNTNGTAKLENIHIHIKNNVTLTGNNSGILIGNLSGTYSYSSPKYATVSNCSVTVDNGIYVLSSTYYSYIGGLAGDVYFGEINDSYSDINIKLGTLNAENEITARTGYTVGGLAGSVSGGNISNSHSKGSVEGISSRAGGLVGYLSGNISNCYSLGSVSASYNLGGLAGYSQGNISDSYAKGDVTTNYTSSSYAGGLVGEASSGNISKSYASGNVTSSGNSVGGLVGYAFWTKIQNCYATGDVSGKNETGGLIGSSSSSSSSPVTNCYAAGSVFASGSAASGLLGYDNYNPVSSYYDKDTTGYNTGKGTAQSTTAMYQAATFTNWDISSTDLSKIWYIYEGEDYPKLSALHQAETIYVGTTDQLTSVGSEIIKTDYDNKKKTWTLDADYILDANINMSGVSIDPIGTAANPFTGTFIGAEDFTFAISDLMIDAPADDNVGLFGYTENAVISNIHLENASVFGNRNVSLLIGCAAGNTEITQCSVTGTVNAAANHAGSLAGLLFEGNITQCYSDADVTADSEAGGIVGAMGGGLISESYAAGSVTAETEVAGGLIAEYAGMSDFVIENSFALNEFVGSPEAAGRIIGVNEDDAVLTSVYAWDEMENTLGTFDDGAENGEDIAAADVWDTFDTSVSPWESWSATVWELGTNEYFLLPVLIDVTDSIADASHLIPADDNTDDGPSGKKSSGGSGTGSAKVIDSTTSTEPQSSSGSTGVDSPTPNAPQSGTQGFETDVGEEKGSGKTLIGILAAGLIVVVLAVGLFIKGRKF